MISKSRWTPALVALLIVPSPLLAQPEGPDGDPVATKIAQASRRSAEVTIDGRIDDGEWEGANPISDFTQYEPSEGVPATYPTEIRVMFDDEALYIAGRMTQPGRVTAPLARRDQLLDSDGNNGSFNSLTTDKIVISLDPYHNRLDNVLFEVNPMGVRGDSYNGDSSWDPIWEAAAHRTADGWTAEMRIPLSQLRFTPDEQTWGLQIWRYVDALNERDMWSFWEQSASGGPSFFGNLEGLAIGRQPRQLEILPYLVTGSTLSDVDPANPYQSSPDLRMGVGGDLKYLLTSNLTLDATFNPDFGQVEVDPATINLSAFETYYAEKRPFFVAGSSAFRFGRNRCMFCTEGGGLNAFYSRRIGRSPQLAGVVDGMSSYSDPPENTSILAAAKVTGRTESGVTIGVLNAVTDQERARFYTPDGGIERSQIVEPATNYFVARANKELRGGATTVGGIFTSAQRLGDDPLVDSRLHGHAEAAGIDWFHSWDSRHYSWMGTTLLSNVAGTPEAIDRTARNSAHYYQRPDRSVTGDGLFDTRLDPTATSMSGYGLYTRVGKDSGGVLRWEGMTSVRSPGLEVNDLSFLNRGDYVWVNGNIGGNWTTPTRWYRSVFTSAGGSSRYNFDGDRLGTAMQAFLGLEFNNYWGLRTFVIHELEAFDDRITRGGPIVRRPGYDVFNVNVSTDARAPVVFDVEVQNSFGRGENTRGLDITPGMAWKPSPNIFVELSPRYSFSREVAQYITRIEDPIATDFFGSRYVFGEISQRSLSLETRINATFTPDLTLQLYAQPFLASVDYRSFREFASPRTLEKRVYGQDIGSIEYDADAGKYRVDADGAGPSQPFAFENPDFTTRSLRGTAVLRWEYRPGSTLFFVWSQERFGGDPFDAFNSRSARTLLLGDPATNVFQIKATYWIG